MPNQHRNRLMRPFSALVDQLPGDYPDCVNIALQRYLYIISTPPQFSENEWNLMRDVCNGWYTGQGPIELLVQGLALEVESAIRQRKADVKWRVDGEALLSKLRELTPAETIATIHAIELYWDGGEDDREEIEEYQE